MKKWIALILVALLALLGYVASGPYRTVQAIREAVVAQDAAALSEQVDFAALRASLKPQLHDRLARKMGAQMQASVFGSIAMAVAGGVLDTTVDAMVTPLGLGALMQGRLMWTEARDSIAPPDEPLLEPPPEPLRDPEYRFESTSRFTATVADDAGRPVMFVLTRDGLHWKLTDIRLPLSD